MATGGVDWVTGQARLEQAIKGHVCPSPALGPVAEKMADLAKLLYPQQVNKMLADQLDLLLNY